MKIVVDAMSGDNAPFEIVNGALSAKELYSDVEIILSGDKNKIEKCAAEAMISLKGVEIVDTGDVITMEDDPYSVMKEHKNSSMGLGLATLKEYGDAFVSAGNTGALHVGSSLIIRPVKGIRRPCIATVLPFPRPVMLADSGANITVTADNMETWAFMCSIYMKNIFGIAKPRIGLLNNGAESKKGTELQIEAYKKLSSSGLINFIGNIEGCDIPFGRCDVLVTDGFSGNIVLKYTEGFGKFFMKTLKGVYSKNLASKMSFLAMKGQIIGLKKQFDASEYGGAPLLGLSKPVIKAHGSSDARAITNAVRQAMNFVKTGVTEEIAYAAIKNSENKKKSECQISE